MKIHNVSRRDTFRLLGGGLALAFAPRAEALEPHDTTVAHGAAAAASAGADLDAWIHIATDGTVTLRVPAAEMGQGVFTSLPMLLAEELDCDWRLVRAEGAPAHRDYARSMGVLFMRRQVTGGSFSVRGYWDTLRQAGATARAMLVAEAADRWDVDSAACTVEAGVVRHGDQQATYGELAAAAATRRPPRGVTPKDPRDFRLLGTSPPRLDLPPKVNGSALFGVDVRLEGMLSGTVVPCPHHGGRLASLDDAAARAVPGVVDVLSFDDEVIVLAESQWAAFTAARALKPTWDPGLGKGLDDAAISAELDRALTSRGMTVQHEGRAPEGGQVVEATYDAPYLEHAPMEPLSAAAWRRDGGLEIWTGNQAPGMVQAMAARLARLPKDAVQVHSTFLGGGFGRRSEMDAPRSAVRAALATERPVKLVWTREATFARGFLRPVARARFRATLVEGRIAHLGVRAAAQNIVERFVPGFLANTVTGAMTVVEGLAHGPYAFPAIEVVYGRVELPIAVGWWRSVHGSFNGFFRECFLDECAHALGKDPVALRRELLADNPRYLAVLNLAVERAGAVPEGQHRGVALFESFGSIVAEVADVTVREGALRVHRIVAAVDCGLVVHPDTVAAQIMGGATMGLSMLLGERLTFRDGACQERNFHQYPLLGPADAPTVEVHLVPSAEPPGGIGEPGLPPLPGAVCNAIFAATGKRLRRMPIADQLA